MHLLDELGPLLPSFLLQQRWFGGKARSLTACRVEDVAELTEHPGSALVIARVLYGDGRSERYALLVVRHNEEWDLPNIGSLPKSGERASEAVGRESTVRALFAGFERKAIPTVSGGQLVYADLTDSARATITDPAVRIKLLGAEQSNTSLRVGSAFVFKLFRRVETGENPELEVGRFLSTRTTFRAAPQLHGSLSYRAASGEAATLGVLQAWVENTGDGWSYVLRQLTATGPQAGAAALAEDMRQLGTITAEFHLALESDANTPAFAPVAVTPQDVAAWVTQISQEASDTFDLISHLSHSWPDEVRALGARVLSLAPRVQHVLSSVDASAAFHTIRIHGDYHLGQTLKTPSGFVIIDFEGEPARPLAERRSKQCCLKDVAGMLRSFDYAVETAYTDHVTLSDRRRLVASMRQAFLDRYTETTRQAHALSIPADRGMMGRWIRVFELEKALYELRYEINNRPSWVRIPLRAVLAALDPQERDTGAAH